MDEHNTKAPKPIEELRFEFEREKFYVEARLKRRELAIKARETSRSVWHNPLLPVAIAGVIGLLGNTVSSLLSSAAERRLEEQKAESARIAEALHTGLNNPDQAAENLKFLVDVGLVTHHAEGLNQYLANRKQGEGASLPIPLSASAEPEPGPAVDAAYRGHDRGGAKTSIAAGKTETFASVGALIAALPPDRAMQQHTPLLTRETMDRSPDEGRNVSLDAWVYAAKYEADNDWHLILGTSPADTTKTYISAEVTGLPPAESRDFVVLHHARESARELLSWSDRAETSRYRRYTPPIAVHVEGSVFYDVDHVPGVVGPTGLQPQTNWEIHPVTVLRRPGGSGSGALDEGGN
jgi:hypothetical protein